MLVVWHGHGRTGACIADDSSKTARRASALLLCCADGEDNHTHVRPSPLHPHCSTTGVTTRSSSKESQEGDKTRQRRTKQGPLHSRGGRRSIGQAQASWPQQQLRPKQPEQQQQQASDGLALAVPGLRRALPISRHWQQHSSWASGFSTQRRTTGTLARRSARWAKR